MFSRSSRDYLQIITTQNGALERIDLHAGTPEDAVVSAGLLDQLKRGAAVTRMPDDAPGLSILSLISVKEDRFLDAAESYEGWPWLARSSGLGNPYDHSREAKRAGGFDLWHQSGRVGGLRGNHSDDGWERQGVAVTRARLPSFATSAGGWPGTSLRMGQAFYGILESSTLALFFTHGGPISGEFQLDQGGVEQGKGLDSWFSLVGPRHRLGSGGLRHLFLQCCGGLSYYTQDDEANRVLVSQWMTGSCVNGLRTICGFDGNGSSHVQCGVLFAEQYNKGNSISNSWLLAAMNEYNGQSLWPATLAFGGTLEEACAILADGRFHTLRGEPRYAVASLWRDADHDGDDRK